MKILILQWDSFGHEYMVKAFKNADCEIEEFCWPYGTEPMRENETLENLLKEHMKKRNYHFVFSFNFFPVAAKVCNQVGTKYVSWIYDSPYLLLYSKHAEYSTNSIYIFDKSICRECWKRGMHNVLYLPMAAPIEDYDKLIENEQNQKRYITNISFVGSTYKETKNDFYSLLKNADAYTLGYLDALMNAQKEMSGVFILEDGLTDDVIEKLQMVCPVEKGEDEWESYGWIYANYFLARKVTGIQRTEILQALSQNYEVRLYTYEETPELTKVINCGTTDYLLEMPLVFRNSRINLNITLKSIHTGIPLRAMEIMGSKGFLLTDYQEDFLDDFEPGKDYVYFIDQEDLVEKVNYYLNHEEERKAVAESGYRKVAAQHTYRHRAEKILQDVLSEKEKELNDIINAIEKSRETQGGCWYMIRNEWEKLEDSEVIAMNEMQMEWMDAEKELLFRCRNILLELVDMALEEGNGEGYEKLCGYFNKNVIDMLFVVFPEILSIYVFVQLYKIEKQNGMQYTISHYRNYKQLVEVHRQITLYLRRIECDLEEKEQMELVRYMKREHLSYMAVYLIMNSNGSLNADIIEQKWQSLMRSGEEQ